MIIAQVCLRLATIKGHSKIKYNQITFIVTSPQHMCLWVKFLRACSRQYRNNLHIDSTYLQTYTEENVYRRMHILILSTHSVLLRHTYSYQYTLYTVCTHSTLCTHIYTHSNMRRCNRLYISYVSWMCIRTTRFFGAVCACSPVELCKS